MRIAIISDSHGNLTALDSVLAEIDRTGPYDEVLMGGDIAYGGPYPRECIERILERGYRAVRGNTDQLIVDAASTGGEAHGAWVLEQIDDDLVAYLDSLPVQVTIDCPDGRRIGLVHATPWSIYESVLPDSEEGTYRAMLAEADANLVAYGHIHLQNRHDHELGVIVAVGSLGLPFDGDQRSMFTTIESTENGWNVEFHRLAYDVQQAIEAARERGGPNGASFAKTLEEAIRPM